MSMNPEIKAQWVAALRSGEYQQGKNYLTRVTPEGDKHCCLGVLCDLAVKAGLDLAVTMCAEGSPSSLITLKAYDSCTGQLPGTVVRWAGLENDRPFTYGEAAVRDTAEYSIGWRPEPDAAPVTLSELNDGDTTGASTFPEIADLIEQHL